MFTKAAFLCTLLSVVNCYGQIINLKMLLQNLETQKYHVTPKTTTTSNFCDNPPILSYHLHVPISMNNQKKIDQAMQFQNDFVKNFNLQNTKNCTFGTSDANPNQQEMCLWPVAWAPKGPFPTAHFSVFVPRKDLQRVTEWAAKKRNGLDVLTHPNTGCSAQDNSVWTSWMGNPWELDASVFTCNAPYPICK